MSAMIDPEGLMFSLPRWRLPFDYCETLEPTEEDKKRARKMMKMTKTLARSIHKVEERQAYEVLTRWR